MGWPAPLTQTSDSRCRDQRGGAISLWVVLMVPVAMFAAVVAMAGPQRMAAESSMEEAAGDLATLAVTLRDGRGLPEDELTEGFLPDCPRIGTGPQADGLEDVCKLLLGDSDTEGYLHRDLGHLGINTGSWQGFYSDSIFRTMGCEISSTRQTKDAVYVALAGDWEDGGWAAAQAWPDGVRVGDEMVARLNLRKSKNVTLTDCSTDHELDPRKNLDPNPPRTVFSD